MIHSSLVVGDCVLDRNKTAFRSKVDQLIQAAINKRHCESEKRLFSALANGQICLRLDSMDIAGINSDLRPFANIRQLARKGMLAGDL
jgi:hypothetical protein